MNKTELIAAIAEKAGLSKKDAEKALNATLDTVADALAAGDKTREAIEIPASCVPVFKAGKALKDKVAK